MERRKFIQAAGLAGISLSLGQSNVFSNPGLLPETEYTLPPLPYPADALEPYIDKRTMEIHHGKHHASYVANVNAMSAGLQLPSNLQELAKKIADIPKDKQTAIRNNGGGHLNHTFFWNILAANAKCGEPSKDVSDAVIAKFGSWDTFKDNVKKSALSRFGSGWVWVVNVNGAIEIGSTANQDNPLMGNEIAGMSGTPLLGFDLWEHAYYLKYQQRRADYIDALWNIVRWDEVNKNYQISKR